MSRKKRQTIESLLLLVAFIVVFICYYEGMAYLFDAYLSGACHQIGR